MAFPSDLTRTKDWGNETLTDADLEGQLDLIIDWVDDFADETGGHKHDGTSNEGPQIALAGASQGVTGTLGLGNGGTGQTTLAGLLGLVYPVGSIYLNATDATNPGTLLGFGTWTAYGAGRVMVSNDSGDTDFDGAEETGGSKTHTLAEAELPSHTHGMLVGNGAGSSATRVARWDDSGGEGTINTQATGSGTAFSIVQPYITVYAWKRTA